MTQDTLIRQIAKKEAIDTAIVRNIFKAADGIIFDYLSSTNSTKDINIKLFNGISLESTYVPEQKINKGIFQNIKCPERIKVKPVISRYYKRKLNESMTLL